MTPPKPSSAAAKPEPEESEPRKLKAEEIEYLAFEGGGGKGFAYLGAIDILERIKGPDGRSVMERVKGFAGASAGAITAFLLSIGYDFKSLSAFLKNTDFDSFYDPPKPRVRPEVGTSGVEVTEDSAAEQAFIRGDIQAWIQAMAAGDEPGTARAVAATLVSSFAPPASVTSLLGLLLTQQRDKILSSLKSSGIKVPPVAEVLLKQINYYFAYLPNDMGLFSGQAARILFESLLRQAVAKKKGGLPTAYNNVTFQEHWDTFHKELLFTGTNLRSGKTQLFSRKQTPTFPVADAVRISMSLPWVFKPYVIKRRSEGKGPPCGVYVDGGVWNNLPFRELDSNPPSAKPPASAGQKSSKASGKPTPRTLGLRLEIDSAPKIESVFDLTAQMLSHGLVGSGESQVMDNYVNQCIVLDTRGLDLLSFSPPEDPDVNLRILNRSRRAVCRYFDLDIDVIQPSIRDDEDDLAREKAMAAAETCEPN